MIRYARLLAVQVRASVLLAMQYRADFVLDGVVELFWASTTLVPFFVVFGARERISGWSRDEALVVVGWFILLQGVLEGAVNPSLHSVVERVRTGTLDFVLLKPKDAQFLVSTSQFSPWKCLNVVTGGVVLWLAFRGLGRAPSLEGTAIACCIFACSVVVLYAITTLVVSASFFVVRVDNLTYLFTAVFDAARWPSSVFRGALRFVFTFVLPFAMMTTWPAEAMLGRLAADMLGLSVALALLFVVVSRVVWRRALRSYASASS